MMRFVVDVMSSVLEVLVLNYFFKNILIEKCYKLKFRVLLNLLYIAFFTLISTYFLTSSLSPILNFTVVVLLCFINYEGKAIKKFLWILIIFTLTILTEIAAGIFITLIYKVNIVQSQDNIIMYMTGAVFSKMILFLIFRVIGLIGMNKKMDVSVKSIIALLMIPLSSVFSFYYITMIAYVINNSILNIFLLITTALIIISNAATFYLIERQSELQKAEQDLINLERQYEMQTDYYAELKENMIITNKNAHDIKNFITGISSYLDKKDTERAKEKIEEFYGKIPTLNKIETGNDAINALLQSKIKTINETVPNNNISVMCPELQNLDEIDVCIIIGNAIDNALEACAKIIEKEKRFLNIKIFPAQNQLSMLFENTKSKSGENSFLTTKQNRYMHGYGIKNMKRICEKYDGNIIFNQTEEMFSVSILIAS